MKTTKIAADLFLIKSEIASTSTPKEPTPIDHIIVVDCSGSMSSDLPKIREQLKAKLPKLLGEKDTVSIVWFSAKNQFGTLITAEPVPTLADLQTIHKAIDRWLRPIGLTGFKEPLEEVSRLIEKIGKDRTFSLFFMSDGCDNQWPRADIIKAVEGISGKVAQAIFVEYGYYADRPLLTQMAEKAGGTLIFAEDFDRYAPTFERILQQQIHSAKRISVDIPGDTIGGFTFATHYGDLYTFSVDEGKVAIPEGIDAIYWLAPNPVGLVIDEETRGNKAAYAAVSLFATRMQPNVVWPLLKTLGDVDFIEQYSSCFGKQKYSAFQELAKSAAFDATIHYVKGFDPNKVPKEDAFTLLELLNILANDENNRVLLEHPDFKYSRIGRGRVDAGEAAVKDLTEQLTNETDETKKQELRDKIATLSVDPLTFKADPAPDGYPISSLTYNEERPNISFMVRKSGSVDLSKRLPSGSKIPAEFKTFVFRNYAVIKDGLVNIDTLPVKLSKSTWNKLVAAEVVTGDYTETVVLNLKSLPIVNRKMVHSASAKTRFSLEYRLTKARAAQKVYGHYKKERFPRKSEGFGIIYGEADATWLKDQGITDYSGFGPKVVQAAATDHYMGKELVVSIKGLSSLPTVKDVKDRIAKGKLTPSASLMVPYVEEVEAFLASDIYAKAPNKDKLFETWLDGQTKAATAEVRLMLSEVAQQTFAVVVGQIWFKEFASLDENSLTIEIDKTKIECKVDMKEVQISI